MTTKIRPLLTGATSPNERNDCTVRALANAKNIEYETAHALLKKHGRKDAKGCSQKVWALAYRGAGMTLVGVYGKTLRARCLARLEGVESRKGTTLGTLLPSLGTGRFVVLITAHALAVIDGQVIDKFGSLAGSSVFGVYRA